MGTNVLVVLVMKNAWINTSNRFKVQIIRKLLGDGSITKQKNRRPRLQINHTVSDYDWISYYFKHLKRELPLNPPYYYKHKDIRLKDGFSEIYYVQSRTSDIICYLKKTWYNNRTKVIPFTLLEKYFSLESLAWWYMDDGHLKVNNHIPQKIILSVENFTDEEIHSLIDFLYNKYRLPFAVDGQRRIALYKQADIYHFLDLIDPYTHISMQRKLRQISFLNKDKLAKKRTTIYLPENIQLIKPTAQINEALYNLDKLIKLYKRRKLNKYYVESIKEKGEKFNYQIAIEKDHINKLNFLKLNSGITYSGLTEMCFTYENKKRTLAKSLKFLSYYVELT